MTASLAIDISDPGNAWAGYDPEIQASLQVAWNAWMALFDWTGGTATLHVRFADLGPAIAASSGPDGVAAMGQDGGRTVEGSSVTSGILGGPAGSGTLTIATGWLTQVFPSDADPSPVWQGDDTRVFQHEFMHVLGADTYYDPATDALPSGWEMAADQYVSFTAAGPVDTGPYAEAISGGPVPLDPATLVHPLEGGGQSVLSYADPASSLQPLDIAMLRDDGVPVLFPQEGREHAVIRLLDTLGQAPDEATVAQDAAQLAGGAGLADLAGGMLQGLPTDPSALVQALWGNAMGTAPLDAGDAASWTDMAANGQAAQAAVAISESDAHRAALAADPNTAYAASTGETAALLYDAAFGRLPDPMGYAHWSGILAGGATPQGMALALTESPEFDLRYGGTDDTGYVNALYADVLQTAPDATAAAEIEALGAGTLTRADLLVVVAEAPVHVAALAAGAAASTVAELGLMPVPWPGQTVTA